MYLRYEMKDTNLEKVRCTDLGGGVAGWNWVCYPSPIYAS